MLRKLLFTAAALVIAGTMAATPAEALPFACTSGMTLDDFISGGVSTDGCTLGDKLFTVGAYTGNLAETDVNVNISNPNAGQFYNVQFDAGANLAFSALELEWDVVVYTGTDVITIVDDQMFAVGNEPTNDAVEFCAEGSCQTAVNAGGGQQVQFNIADTQSLQNSASYTQLVGGTGLQSVEQTIQQTSVPEPASLLLFGAALAGYAARRKGVKA